MIYHELGHVKDGALTRYLIKGGAPSVKISKGGYSLQKRTWNRLKKCFKITYKERQPWKHHERPWELYASLQELFTLLGRPYLIPTDIELVLLMKNSPEGSGDNEVYEKYFPETFGGPPEQRPGEIWIRTLGKDALKRRYERICPKTSGCRSWSDPAGASKEVIIEAAFLIIQSMSSSEVWETYDWKKCSPKYTANMLNSLAKLDIKKAPPQQQKVVAENILDMIEKTIDEQKKPIKTNTLVRNIERRSDRHQKK